MTGPQRISQAQVAKRLGLARSTVSRWIQKHPALADQDGKIDLDAFRAHRASMIDPALQTKTAGAPAAPEAAADPVEKPRLQTARERKAEADTIGAELDLAARLGLTLRLDDVLATVADAGQALRAAAQEQVRSEAERLAQIDDVRAMERALEELMRRVLSAGADALRRLGNQDQDDAAA